MSNASLDAWLATMARRLVARRKRKLNRSKDYGNMYERMLETVTRGPTDNLKKSVNKCVM